LLSDIFLRPQLHGVSSSYFIITYECFTRGYFLLKSTELFHLTYLRRRDSSVGIALGYGLDDRVYRVQFPGGGWEFFSSPLRPERLWGPASLLSNVYQGSFPGVKRSVREADHSLPSSAEVKECVELYLHFPNTPSWCGAQFKKSTGTTFPLPYRTYIQSFSCRVNREVLRTAVIGILVHIFAFLM
jgi:hypothetical protein